MRFVPINRIQRENAPLLNHCLDGDRGLGVLSWLWFWGYLADNGGIIGVMPGMWIMDCTMPDTFQILTIWPDFVQPLEPQLNYLYLFP